jgi:hypothetical protein
MVARRAADVGAGVARMMCVNGPNVDVEEWRVYCELFRVICVMLVEMCMFAFGMVDVRAETTAPKPF